MACSFGNLTKCTLIEDLVQQCGNTRDSKGIKILAKSGGEKKKNGQKKLAIST